MFFIETQVSDTDPLVLLFDYMMCYTSLLDHYHINIIGLT